MKKIKSIVLLTFLLAACQENSVTKKEIDYHSVIANLEVAYNGAFSVALQSKPGHLYSNTYDYLKGNYFSGSYQFDPNEIKAKLNKTARISSADELDLSYLTEEQKTLTVPFLNSILNQDDLSAASLTADNFNNLVMQSTLSDLQKYQLLTIGTAVKAGIKVIQDNTAKSSRIAARVDVKGALQSGVIGLASGAVGGCYTGATGGTVAFPGLGTATGCLGGAVIGGALGFIGGVVGSIAQDLLFG
jgi:hypothetical protein